MDVGVVLVARFSPAYPLTDLRFIRSPDDARDYSSSVDVSYFATFGTYVIRRDDIGSSGTWRVRRETRKTIRMWRTRERKRTRVVREGERMNNEEVERERERRDEEGRIRMVRGWRDTVNRWEAINFGLECPIAPHFVQCKFTPDANHLAPRSSFSFGRENPNWETNVMPYQR